jgi:hypothetical protein
MEAAMNAHTQLQHGSVYRIDKFAVPVAAREEFLAQIEETKVFLDTQAGCRQNLVLEVQSGSDRFNFLTVVEWDSVAAFEKAKAAMGEVRRASAFDPRAFLGRLGIEADMANYGVIG